MINVKSFISCQFFHVDIIIILDLLLACKILKLYFTFLNPFGLKIEIKYKILVRGECR